MLSAAYTGSGVGVLPYPAGPAVPIGAPARASGVRTARMTGSRCSAALAPPPIEATQKPGKNSP